MTKFSRRAFLEAGAVSSVAIVGSGVAAQTPPARPSPSPTAPDTVALSPASRDLLRAAMDEIIPKSDGMPSASEVGSLEYLEQLSKRHARSAKELAESLDALERSSQRLAKASFVSLPKAGRIEQLTALEKQDRPSFQNLRDFVYEAYYTRPEVWKLIGYEFYPTDGPGPALKKVWNEAAVEQVRKKPKGYVEVS